MSVIRSRPGTPNALFSSASSARRAQRNRRRSTVETLEGRVVPSFVFSYNSTTKVATATETGSDSSLVFAQTAASGIEYNLNNTGFVNTWGGSGPVPNTAGVTVNVIEATGTALTLGTPGAPNPVSPFSTFNVNFAISGSPTSSSLVIDDSTGTLAGTYSYNGSTFLAPSNISLSNTATQSGGVTIKGSAFSDTYNALGSKSGEAVSFIGNTGSNTVNVGNNPGSPGSSTLSNVLSAVSFTDAQTGGTAAVNIYDAGTTTSATGTISFSSPNELISGLGFGTGGSFGFNTGTPGATSLSVNTGSSGGGAGGVTTNVISTPSTLTTTITGKAVANIDNIGGTAPGNLSNVAGAVTVAGGGSTAAINVNDQSTSASETYTITGTAVTRPSTFGGLTYSGIGALTLNAGTGTNIINVTSTLNSTTTTLNGGSATTGTINVNGTGTGGTLNVNTSGATTSGSTVNVVADSEPVNVTTNGTPTADTVNIGAAGGTGNLPGITGLVTLTGNQPYALAINDQGDASAQTYNVNILNGGTNTGSLALGSAAAILSFHPLSVVHTGTGFTFNGGSHGNIINFNDLTPSSVTTQINAGAGNDTTTLRGSGVSSTVNIDSQGGTNTIVLGKSTQSGFLGTHWFLGTSVNVSGTGGTTGLTIDDSNDPAGQTATLSGTSVTGLSPASLNFTSAGTTSLAVNGGSGGNAFTVNGTLANASVNPTVTTLNKGAGANNSVLVQATSAGSALDLTGTGTPDTVDINPSGNTILGTVNINEAPGSTTMTVDLSDDGLAHTLDVSSDGTTSTLHDELGNMANVTYVTTSLASLTINTDGSESQTLNLNFGNGGNPIPTASSPGLVFNAINPAPGVSNVLNIFGTLPTGAFASETHNANDQTVFPQVGQYGSIFFVDSASNATSLDYTGLQPINDTTPATLYTFNDFGYPDQSFLASDGPAVLGFATVQFVNTPTPPTPLNFETTTIANKANVVFNTPPLTLGVGPAVSGVVNIPTASTGLTSLTFNVPNDADNNVSFLAVPNITGGTTYIGDGAHEATSVAGAGVAAGATLTVNGGPAINTLTYDAGDNIPTVRAIAGGISISVPGAGTVDAFNYQHINIVNVAPLVVTPTSAAINSVEGFNYVGIPVGSFTAPVPTIFAGLPVGAPPVPTLPASSFTSSINWGDPSPDLGAGTITQNAANPSIYYVTGTHTFPLAGTNTVVSTINSSGGSITYPVSVALASGAITIPVTVSFNPSTGAPITSSATATVTQGPIAVTVLPIVGTEGTALGTVNVATFVDAGGQSNTAADYTATVTIVAPDGTVGATITGTVTPLAAGQFSVSADLGTPPEEGVYQIQVAITDNSVPATPITVTGASTATIADALLTAGPAVLLSLNTGALSTNVIGSFTDGNAGATTADYTGTINWGDGSPATAATFVATATPGVFDVEGTHAYANPSPMGGYTITTVVNDDGGSTVTLLATATVTDLPVAPVTGTATTISAVEGLNTGTIVLANIMDPNPLATASSLTAVINNWGDNTPSSAKPLAVVLTGSNGTDSFFQVLGSHTYTEEGTALPVSLTVTTSGGVATTITGTANVADAPLSSTGSVSVTGTEGITTGTVLIATFTDANPFATTADFSGTVNWGDGGAPLPLTPGDFAETGTANGVVFTVSAAHTYSEEGSYQITTVINDDGGSTTTAHGSAVIADAALTATTPQPAITASTGQSLPATTVVGTFTDANPKAPISDFTATISWGDGSPITQGTIVQPGGVGTVFQVEGGHTYAAHGTYTITTVVTDVGGSVVTLVNTATVTDPVPTGVYQNFTAQEGLNTGTIVLATVTDPDTTATVADLESTLVTWGDGTPTSPVTIATVATGGNSSDTLFQILGSHTYKEEGTFTFTLTSTTPGGVATTFTPAAGGTATVNDAPLSSSGSISITGIEGNTTGPKLIGTFTDANPFATVSEFTTGGGSVVVTWGDGSAPETLPASAITATGSANGVLFSVTAAHTYPEEGSYQISIAVADDGGATTVAHASAVISDAALTAGSPVALTPNTGVLLTNTTVATFTDANPAATVSDFTATIDWGDGTPTTVGTIAQPGGVGTAFDVEGTHAYAKPGTYQTKVVVTDVGGSVVYIPGTATVTDPSLSGTAVSFTAQEGLTTGTILLATIDNPNTLAGVSQLTATVNWGDSATDFVVPVVLAGGTPTDSIFQINSSHTYADEGTYTVSILVTTTGGATTAPLSPLTATATVVDAPIVSVGSDSISGVEGITTGPKLVATWTDTNPGATVADYTAGGGSVVVNWGDGTAPVTLPASAITATGSPNGVVFSATAAHTYAEAGSYQVTTVITDDGGSKAVAHGTAVIADAPLSSPPQVEATKDIDPNYSKLDLGTITQAIPFTAVVATFTDANPLGKISDFANVSIDWGDGTPNSAGTVIQPGGVGTTFEVLGTHTYAYSNSINGAGDFPTVINVRDVDGSAIVINASVTVANLPLTLTGKLNPSSDSGQSSTDAITNVNQPNFYGVATVTYPDGEVEAVPGADITLFATPSTGGSPVQIGQTEALSDGSWSITSSFLNQGQYTITAHASGFNQFTTGSTQILPNATQGLLTIDTTAPKVTALSFDRVDGQIDLTFQDNLSGMDQAQVIDAANYQLTKLHTIRGRYVVNVISATPSGLTGPENVVLTINDGRQLRGGIYYFTVFSGSGATGIRDVAGNALDGEFYGYFPSGNNIPGGNFVAGLDAVHHTIFAPKTIIGHATPVSPPGTPATGTTIPTANPQLPSGNPNFHGNPSLLKGAKVHHKVQVAQKKADKALAAHDLALEELAGGHLTLS